MKKGKFIILLVVLISVLLTIVGFIYFFHQPYTKWKQDLNEAKYEVLEKNDLNSLDEFHQYNTFNLYYIGKDENNVYVFNEEYQMIKWEELSSLNEELVKERLASDYGITDFEHLELGYENKTLCYLCRNNLDNITQYIYLNAQDGTEIKFYELGK